MVSALKPSEVIQLATHCNYKNYEHLDEKSKALVKKLADPLTVIQTVKKALTCCYPTDATPRLDLLPAIEIIKKHLESKRGGFFKFIFQPGKKKLIEEALELIKINKVDDFFRSTILVNTISDPTKKEEKIFLMKFVASLPKQLGIKNALSHNAFFSVNWIDGEKDEKQVNEQKMITWLAEAVYNSCQVSSLSTSEKRWSKFNEIMLGAYRGDHLLIEDNLNHSQLDELKEFGAVIRTSSHYEKGREVKEFKDGKAIYGGEKHAEFKKAQSPHYGLTGSHIKHILFNSVEMTLQTNDKETPVFSYTAAQVNNLIKANKPITVNNKKVAVEQINQKKTRHYIALQFESSPDSEGNNLLSSRFYTHRLLGFLRYRVLKIFVAKANIGPYGRGVTDQNPVVLSRFA